MQITKQGCNKKQDSSL